MKKNILVVAPVLSRSGYGEQARFAVRCLASRPDLFNVFIKNIPWGGTGWIDNNHVDREYIDSKIVALGQQEESWRADVSLQTTIPNEFKIYCPINIGYTAGIESDRVDHNWIVSSNMMNGLIVVSNHAAKTFKKSRGENEDNTNEVKLEVPIAVVNYPYEPCEAESINLTEIKTKFNFLSVAQISPRKNIYNSIKWFIEEFKNESEIGFIVKLYSKNCSTIDRYYTFEKLRTFIETVEENRKCKIYLIHGDLSTNQMVGMYKSDKISAFLTASHGEGFGLPIFEAAAHGLPILSPDWGGQKDFLYAPFKENGETKKFLPAFIKIDHEIKQVDKSAIWPGVINEDARWAFVKEASFKKALREVRENYEVHKLQAKALELNIKTQFTFKKKSAEFVAAITEHLQ